MEKPEPIVTRMIAERITDAKCVNRLLREKEMRLRNVRREASGYVY